MSRGKNWCFTLNNYTNDEVDYISNLVINEKCTYIIYGKEIGESGTPHLQGFVSFDKRAYLNDVKRRVSERAHFETARNVNASIEYCKKDGDVFEDGDPPVSNQGKRCDLDDFKADVKNGMLNFKEIREKHSSVYAKYRSFVAEYVLDNSPKRLVHEYPLHEWQQDLVNILSEEPDERTINFVVDLTGNNGKTWFAHWYASKHDDVQVMTPGKKSDMAYLLRTDIRVLILDAPRSKQGEFIQYDFLEDIKNGYIFSPKYESSIKNLKNVHLVVLMNEQPDLTKLSFDRFNVINI